MKIVFAPDSFKGSIRANDAAHAMAGGWLSVRPDDEVRVLPMADGGEGTLEAFEQAIASSRRMPVTVEGPTACPVETHWLYLTAESNRPATGVIELASTSGFELLPDGETETAMAASSFGFGQAIVDALAHGVTRLILTIGGSASSDGGAGMLTAMGARILDRDGAEVARGATGLETAQRVSLDRLPPLPPYGVLVLSDVVSPLLGSNGAARMFSPQKGATLDEVERIEVALTSWAHLLGADPDAPGAGAAGGVGFGLLAWGASLTSGAEAVADLVGLGPAVEVADLVVTGEGLTDAQSEKGKAPAVVLAAAQQSGVPVALISGQVTQSPTGCAEVISLATLAGSVERAMQSPGHWLTQAAAQLASRYSPPLHAERGDVDSLT